MMNLLGIIILALILTLSINYINRHIIKLFEANNIKQALITTYVTLGCSIIVVSLMTLLMRNMVIDFAKVFYR
ncbi:hypothetical protein [Macrococcus sp. DPC7161]|uniref:hypothetical protein n=1 Tax=Macrococcus sp. DPC7161 TaxID=2507060 RepID=UPI00100A4CF8|nr:hypothetical protein [Macrococcus sp. DPC7161]RXK18002.1 hypothetical protein ER639_07410 [Macrococcus sp. DPC7161]